MVNRNAFTFKGFISVAVDRKIVCPLAERDGQGIGTVVDPSLVQRKLLVKTDAIVLPLIVLILTLGCEPQLTMDRTAWRMRQYTA